MIEDIRVIKKVRTVIKRSANKIVKRILLAHDNIKGREEEITVEIKSEINRHLLKEIAYQLNEKEIEGIKFEVRVYQKKTEEPKTGADIAGILNIRIGNKQITKAYLAQSKIENVINDEASKGIIGFTNSDIQEQTRKMLNITNSSYVFIYSKRGVDVLSAQAVNSMNSNKIKVNKSLAHDIGFFYEEFFRCFIGDHKLTPYPVEEIDLMRFAEETNANNVLLIKGTKENNEEPKSRFAYVEI